MASRMSGVYRPRRYGSTARRAYALPYGGARKSSKLRKTQPSSHARIGSTGRNEYHGDHKDNYVLSIGALTVNPYKLPSDFNYQDANGRTMAAMSSNLVYHVAAALLRRVLKMVVKRDIQYPQELLLYDLTSPVLVNTGVVGGAGTGSGAAEKYGPNAVTSMNASRLRFYFVDGDNKHPAEGARHYDFPFVDHEGTTKYTFAQVALEMAEILQDMITGTRVGLDLYAVELFQRDYYDAPATTGVMPKYIERSIAAPINVRHWIYSVSCSGFMRIQNQTLNDDGTAATDVVNGNPLVCVRQVFRGFPIARPALGSNPQAPISTGPAGNTLRNPWIFQQESDKDCILKHLNHFRRLPPRHTWENCIGEERFTLPPGGVYTIPLRDSFRGKLRTLLWRLEKYEQTPVNQVHRPYTPFGHAHIVFATPFMAADYPVGDTGTGIYSETAQTVAVPITVQYHAEFKCGASVMPKYKSTMMMVDAVGIYQRHAVAQTVDIDPGAGVNNVAAGDFADATDPDQEKAMAVDT